MAHARNVSKGMLWHLSSPQDANPVTINLNDWIIAYWAVIFVKSLLLW